MFLFLFHVFVPCFCSMFYGGANQATPLFPIDLKKRADMIYCYSYGKVCRTSGELIRPNEALQFDNNVPYDAALR